MSAFDDFWDDLIDAGVLGPDQAGRARIQYAQHGGGLDTAVLETVALDAQGKELLVELAARSLALPVAPIEFIDAPDLEQLARIPREVTEEFGILPSRELNGRPALVVPPLAQHRLDDLRQTIETDTRFYIAGEVEIREALNRFAGIALPARFEALWTGLCPSVMEAAQAETCGPVPVPRSTVFRVLEDGIQDADGYKETDDYEVVGKGPALTRPGRPSALMIADTGEFMVASPARNESVAPRHQGPTDTCDDATAIVLASEDGLHASQDYLSESGELSSVETTPPAGR